MRSRLALILAVGAVVLSSCRDAEIASYRVPKEKPEPLPPILTGGVPATPSTAPSAGGDMASTAVPTAAGNGLTWTAPSHWKQKPASAMRKGSYTVSGSAGAEADMSITAFPGDVGGTLANVNRWRGQIELPPLTESDLGSVMQHHDAGDIHVDVVEFANTESSNPQRIIGAIVPFQGATWFFKLTGPDALIAEERAAFLSLVQSIKASTPAAR